MVQRIGDRRLLAHGIVAVGRRLVQDAYPVRLVPRRTIHLLRATASAKADHPAEAEANMSAWNYSTG